MKSTLAILALCFLTSSLSAQSFDSFDPSQPESAVNRYSPSQSQSWKPSTEVQDAAPSDSESRAGILAMVMQDAVAPLEVRGARSLRRMTQKAIKLEFRAGTISKLERNLMNLHILFPRTLQRWQEGLVVNMETSGTVDRHGAVFNASTGKWQKGMLPVNEDGNIIEAEINWENFLAFLREFLPILIQIIGIFSALDTEVSIHSYDRRKTAQALCDLVLIMSLHQKRRRRTA